MRFYGRDEEEEEDLSLSLSHIRLSTPLSYCSQICLFGFDSSISSILHCVYDNKEKILPLSSMMYLATILLLKAMYETLSSKGNMDN